MSKKAEIVQSTCAFCDAGCGVLVHVKDGGEPFKVEGNPNYPLNKGKLCILGMASLEHLYHPDRLTSPPKRAREQGENKWQNVTWGRALDTIANELNKAKKQYGAESVAFMQGCYKGYSDSHLARLANVFGSPNTASMSYICFHPRLRWMLAIHGFMSRPDYEYPPASVMIWGANPIATAFPAGNQLLGAV